MTISVELFEGNRIGYVKSTLKVAILVVVDGMPKHHSAPWIHFQLQKLTWLPIAMHKTSFIWMLIKRISKHDSDWIQILAMSALSKLVFINCLFYKQRCVDHYVWKLKTPNLLIQRMQETANEIASSVRDVHLDFLPLSPMDRPC